MIKSLTSEELATGWVAAFNGPDVNAWRAWCATDLVVHVNAPADGVSGLDAVALSLRIYRNACPDARFAVESISTERGRLVCRWIGRGTNTAPFLHIPPTRREVVVRGVCQFKIVDDVVVEHWFDYDLYALYEQIDALLPAPGVIDRTAEAISQAAVASLVDVCCRRLALTEPLFTDDVVVHTSCLLRRTATRGRDALLELAAFLQSRLNDLRITIDDHVGQGRTVIARGQLSGRRPSTGELVTFRFYCLTRTRAGAVEAIWVRTWRHA